MDVSRLRTQRDGCGPRRIDWAEGKQLWSKGSEGSYSVIAVEKESGIGRDSGFKLWEKQVLGRLKMTGPAGCGIKGFG